jgi:hypothetical protein
MAAQLNLVQHRTLWEILIKTILSGTRSSIRTKLWWNSHWMVLFQNCVRTSFAEKKQKRKKNQTKTICLPSFEGETK